MARSKQPARKTPGVTTGGKAPRKHLVTKSARKNIYTSIRSHHEA